MPIDGNETLTANEPLARTDEGVSGIEGESEAFKIDCRFRELAKPVAETAEESVWEETIISNCSLANNGQARQAQLTFTRRPVS
jgi:hypothetical protein